LTAYGYVRRRHGTAFPPSWTEATKVTPGFAPEIIFYAEPEHGAVEMIWRSLAVLAVRLETERGAGVEEEIFAAARQAPAHLRLAKRRDEGVLVAVRLRAQPDAAPH
jgi:hypothetical protein